MAWAWSREEVGGHGGIYGGVGGSGRRGWGATLVTPVPPLVAWGIGSGCGFINHMSSATLEPAPAELSRVATRDYTALFPDDLLEEGEDAHEDVEYDLAQQQWEQSVDQLNKLLFWVLVPVVGKVLGRRFAHRIWQEVAARVWRA